MEKKTLTLGSKVQLTTLTLILNIEYFMIKISKIIFHMSFYPANWILNDENIEEYYVYCTCFHSLTLMLKIEPLLLRLRSTEAFLATAWLKKVNVVFDINK